MTKKMEMREDFYTQTPYQALIDEELTHAEYRIYSYMNFRYRFFFRKGWDYYESIPTIAENVRIDKKTVSRAIQKFKKLGYMDVVKEAGKANKYILPDRDGIPF